ncbi:glycosyltransferase [bacterium]|nr:glycosyltransferase [bacterium]
MIETVAAIVVWGYIATLAGLAVWGAHRYALLYLFHRHRAHRRTPPPVPFDELPRVTVQLPLFNEMYVAARLIDAVCAFDYPKDKLEIQVLDDSIDETRAVVDERVAALRERGVNIAAVRRPGREGYKAGALQFGLACATGEFVAVFDADFVPRPDFLSRTIHHFTDERVGMVQTRWTHINESDSLCTACQALYLDGHFVIEHAARNWSGRFFNFNGTAGIWRRRAIEDAGGWEHDTITEDLDLSYRAQMRGWRFRYLIDVEAPGELPALISAFRTQQARWAKGSIETARKILPRLWRSDLSFAVKLEASFHLLANLAYLLVGALCLLAGPSLVLRVHMGWRSIAWLDLLLFLSVSASLFLYHVEARRQIGRPWRDVLWRMPLLMALGIGMAPNNARAVLQGLAGRTSAFVRTPKHGDARGAAAARVRYRPTVDGLLVVEMLLGLSFLLPISYAIRYEVWASLPFLVLFLFGYTWVAGMSLWQRAAPIIAGLWEKCPRIVRQAA